ncbi:hypothetical protein ACHAXN_007798 [Cyclotella atomus]
MDRQTTAHASHSEAFTPKEVFGSCICRDTFPRDNSDSSFERYLVHSVPGELIEQNLANPISGANGEQRQKQRGYNRLQESISNPDRQKENTTSSQNSRAELFPWDRDNICFVVENICNLRKSQWFYFSNDRRSSCSEAKHQPKHFSMPGRLGPFISPDMPKETITKLHPKKCMISNVTNHVVISGRHIRMMGEYYQRIMLPLHHLMQDYMSSSNSTSTNEKEVQFYIHFSDIHQKVLDSHYLYTMGLPFGDNVKHWIDYISNVKMCQCYRRLVFCGYTYGDSDPSERDTKLNLIPYHFIADNPEKHCNAGYNQKTKLLATERCYVWQDLRSALVKTLESTHPNLHLDVQAYRKQLIGSAVKPFSSEGEQALNQHDYKIIGLSQRSDRRKWLDINETISHCNKQYHSAGIVCVEVDVANLPTNFISIGTEQPLSSIEEQLVLYQSIDALIGIHGSQLTQGVLLKSNSVVVELLPWLPDKSHWKIPVHGDGWVNRKDHPTPMGIMWHNTDINEAGYYLSRESVPLCHNKSDYDMHNFSGEELPNYYHMKEGANITEL